MLIHILMFNNIYFPLSNLSQTSRNSPDRNSQLKVTYLLAFKKFMTMRKVPLDFSRNPEIELQGFQITRNIITAKLGTVKIRVITYRP